MRCRDAARGTRFQGFVWFLEGLLTGFTHNSNCCGEWLGMVSACFQDDVRCLGSLPHKKFYCARDKGNRGCLQPAGGSDDHPSPDLRSYTSPMLLLTLSMHVQSGCGVQSSRQFREEKVVMVYVICSAKWAQIPNPVKVGEDRKQVKSKIAAQVAPQSFSR